VNFLNFWSIYEVKHSFWILVILFELWTCIPRSAGRGLLTPFQKTFPKMTRSNSLSFKTWFNDRVLQFFVYRLNGFTSFARHFFARYPICATFQLRDIPFARLFRSTTFQLRDIPLSRLFRCATFQLRDIPSARHPICATSHLRDFSIARHPIYARQPICATFFFTIWKPRWTSLIWPNLTKPNLT